MFLLFLLIAILTNIYGKQANNSYFSNFVSKQIHYNTVFSVVMSFFIERYFFLLNVGSLPISMPPKAKFVNISFAQWRLFMATVTELDTYQHKMYA